MDKLSLINEPRPSAGTFPRFTASRERPRQLADGFLAAAEQGDMQALTSLLAQEVVVVVGDQRQVVTERASQMPSTNISREDVHVAPGPTLAAITHACDRRSAV